VLLRVVVFQWVDARRHGVVLVAERDAPALLRPDVLLRGLVEVVVEERAELLLDDRDLLEPRGGASGCERRKDGFEQRGNRRRTEQPEPGALQEPAAREHRHVL